MKTLITGLTLAALVLPTQVASADVVTRTGVDELNIANVFRSFFGGTGRNILAPGGSGRFQVNGDRRNNAENVFGIFTVIDIPTADFANVDVTDIANLTLTLPPATRTDTGAGGIQDAGDLSVYFTANDSVIGDLEFVSLAGPPYTTPTGFGDQFPDAVVLSSEFEAEGVRTITRSIMPDAAVESALIDAINAGESIRLLLASETPGAVFQLASGNPTNSMTLPFEGLPPSVSFDLTLVPEPASMAFVLPSLLLLKRRR